MQTFLPYSGFYDSARSLDYKRLGKQRVEVKQLLKALKEGGAWANHPAAKMWRGYEGALAEYGNAVLGEWEERGFRNNMPRFEVPEKVVYPPWIGNESFHASHRAALLHKDFEFYKQWNWEEKPKLEYVWPVK